MTSSTGISEKAVAQLDNWPHVEQSIKKILTTMIGTRVMRRDFGSRVPDLIDAKMTRRNVLALYSAVAISLKKWEPRFSLTNAAVDDATSNGVIELVIAGTYYPLGHLGDFSVLEDKRSRVVFSGT